MDVCEGGRLTKSFSTMSVKGWGDDEENSCDRRQLQHTATH